MDNKITYFDTDKINKAKELSRNFHRDHYRISGENYYDHAKKIAHELEDIKFYDSNLIITAYLHHLPDFESKALSKIENEFGSDIAELIKQYKVIRGLEIPNVEPHHINQNNIIQTFLNLIKDPGLLVLRIIDKSENIKTAHTLDIKKANNSALRALYIYSPICRLLGLYKYLKILEDTSFKILNPRDYYVIQGYLSAKKDKYMKNMEDAKKIISEILLSKGIGCEIKFRIKNIYSIYQKAKKKNAEITNKGLTSVKDIAAMRILVDTEEHCYLVEDVLNQLFDSVEGTRDDYILKPKPNEYKSIHNVYELAKNVEVEIQIRTFDMHKFNETGVGSHTFYKLGKVLENKIATNPNILSEINYFTGDTMKIDHFSDFVYVFTPLGDIIELPNGSNLIDFAYTIHDDLGNKCVGAIVNGELQKLTYTLKDGDRVEIKTSNNRKIPNRDWLKEVKTKRARSCIRKALREISQV